MSRLNTVNHYHNCMIVQYSPYDYLPSPNQRRWQQSVTVSFKKAWNHFSPFSLLLQCKNRAYKILKKSDQSRLLRANLSAEKRISPPTTATRPMTGKTGQISTVTPHNPYVQYPSMVLKHPKSDLFKTAPRIHPSSSDRLLNVGSSNPLATSIVAEKNGSMRHEQMTQEHHLPSFNAYPKLDEVKFHPPVKPLPDNETTGIVAGSCDLQVTPEVNVQQLSATSEPTAPDPEGLLNSLSLDSVAIYQNPKLALDSDVHHILSEHSDTPASAETTLISPSDSHANLSLEEGCTTVSDSVHQNLPVTESESDDQPDSAVNGHSATFSPKTAKGLGIAAAAIGVPIAVSGAIGYGMYLLAFSHPMLLVGLGCVAVGIAGYRAFNWLKESLTLSSNHE